MKWLQVYDNVAFAELPGQGSPEVTVSDRRDDLPDDPRYGYGRKPGFYATYSYSMYGSARRVKGPAIGPYKTMAMAKKKAEEKWGSRSSPRRKNPQRYPQVPIGEVREIILDIVNRGGHGYLSDIARSARLRGVHFKRIMAAAETLAKEGKVRFDGATVSAKSNPKRRKLARRS